MRVLLSERFAPITSAIGFLRLDLERSTQALTQWLTELHRVVTVENYNDGLVAGLRRLEPLTTHVYPRELLVAMQGWTAYFSCSAIGTDAVSTVGYLAQASRCDALAIRANPSTLDVAGGRQGRYGSVQFEMFGPEETDFMNYVRVVYAAHDGTRWVFGARGKEQSFEDVRAYSARRVRDRFTSEMLERYCQALGIDAFNPAAYGPEHVVVRTQLDLPPEALVLSLEQAQQRLGILPGMADRLPG